MQHLVPRHNFGDQGDILHIERDPFQQDGPIRRTLGPFWMFVEVVVRARGCRIELIR